MNKGRKLNMQRNLWKILIVLISTIMFLSITSVKTVANLNCIDEEIHRDKGTCDHFFIDAFIIGIIQKPRVGQYGIIYFNATIVFTNEFHRFYTGKMEITGFHGIIGLHVICGFYNDGW